MHIALFYKGLENRQEGLPTPVPHEIPPNAPDLQQEEQQRVEKDRIVQRAVREK